MLLSERDQEFHLYKGFTYDTEAATYPVINLFTDSRLLFIWPFDIKKLH